MQPKLIARIVKTEYRPSAARFHHTAADGPEVARSHIIRTGGFVASTSILLFLPGLLGSIFGTVVTLLVGS